MFFLFFFYELRIKVLIFILNDKMKTVGEAKILHEVQAETFTRGK